MRLQSAIYITLTGGDQVMLPATNANVKMELGTALTGNGKKNPCIDAAETGIAAENGW